MPKLSANLGMLFTEVEFLERFGRAAEAGFTAVEYPSGYDWPAEELADRLAQNGLEQVLLNMPAGDRQAGERGLAALCGREAEFRESVGTALDYAQILGCPRLHAMAGIVTHEARRGEMEETYIENLKVAAGACAEMSVKLLIEPINPDDMPGYFLNGSAQALAIIDAVGSDNLYLEYDLYHMHIMGDDLAATIAANLPRIAHFQIAGVPGRHEPDGGDIDTAGLFDLIDKGGYDGWIGCEYHPRAGTEEGLGWARAYGIGG
ncbi:MAG: hydroxypyruvate isomerase family protein [Proteobacteria bacterium]|nr:hydroxypyruvate isomerase family protein [Pseudomonadota bacterium]